MIRISGLKARFAILALLVFALVSFVLLGPYKVTPGHLSPATILGQSQGQTSEALLTGHAIAPKLGNATAKYVSQSAYMTVIAYAVASRSGRC